MQHSESLSYFIRFYIGIEVEERRLAKPTDDCRERKSNEMACGEVSRVTFFASLSVVEFSESKTN